MSEVDRSCGITSDNIHLSKPTPLGSKTTFQGPVAECTDPKILELVAAATASNTRRAYVSDLAHFLDWGGNLPADGQAIAEYLATHSDLLSPATLARRLVAVRRAHVLRGFADPTKAELVRLTLRGIRRLHGRPQRRVAPLRIEHLFAIVSLLSSSIRDARDRALLLVGFAGAFRRSELTSIKCDWIRRSEQGIEITLPRSKTDQRGVGRSVAVPRVGGPICPVTALEAWLQTAEIADGSLFRRVDMSGKVLPGALSPAVTRRARSSLRRFSPILCTLCPTSRLPPRTSKSFTSARV